LTRDGKNRERRNREARHDYDETSLHSVSRDSLDADYPLEGDVGTPKRSNNLLKAAAAGAAGAALAKGLSSGSGDTYQSEERKQRERRRRRTDSARSRSLGRERYVEEYDDEEEDSTTAPPMPPMPLMSDINPSELTRTSILSADSDRPQSASEELGPVRTVPVGAHSTPGDLHHGLGTQHANISHGDLTALPRGKSEFSEEYETDEYGRKVPLSKFNDYNEPSEPADSADYPETGYDNSYYSTQDVPPPLKYVPYQAGARGLSPIPSVSGYTEGGSEAPMPRNSRGSDVYSPEKSARFSRSVHSLDSTPSNIRSMDFDERSLRSPTGDYRHSTYTDEGTDLNSAVGQTVQGVGANPNIVHPSNPALESAVASLVDGSMLEQSVLTSGSGYDYAGPQDSTVSYDAHSKVQSSRGMSPEKMSIDSRHEYEDERHATPGARSQAQSQEFSEYEVDEYGRKVRSKYRDSPTASEAAITAGAVGAAAEALKRAKEARMQATVEDASTVEADFEPAGVSRNKSFKQRTMEGHEPRSTPAHSIDRLEYDEQPKMGASGLPDLDNPMPAYGYMDDDAQTSPSVVQERLDGQAHLDEYDGRATPTQQDITGYADAEKADHSKGLGITEVVGAAALGAAAGMAATHSREPSQDQEDWHRTSEEHKRDTLVTNPYEDASPINNPALNDSILRVRGLEPGSSVPYHPGSPSFGGHKYDEGYQSNGPNRTPDIYPKGKAVSIMNPHASVAEDPFYEAAKNHTRHLSGMSQGMASPFYDAATGAGIERIENKDIVALMQHVSFI
jgi:hypothetical protein